MHEILDYIKKNYREITIVSVITFFALVLRLVMLQNYGDLWLDELYSWYFSSQNGVIDTVLELIKQDIHMPIYFVILHFWMKLFGQTDVSMHLCTLILTLPLIPITFYATKKIFNKETAYFSAIFLAINSWCIYYSLEVRFYGLVFVLAILSAFSFAKMLDTFERKYTVFFVISHALLIYMFSITGLLTIMYALYSIIYLLINRKDKLKQIARTFGVLFLVSIPAIVTMIYNTYVFNNEICSFVRDIYIFNLKDLQEFLEVFFSNENKFLVILNSNGNLVPNVSGMQYIFFVAIPIVIGCVGLFRSLFSKNKILYSFLVPSLMFAMMAFILAIAGKMALLTRYSTIIFPIIICSACYGLSLFKWKKVNIIIFLLWIVINYLYLYLIPVNLLTTPRVGLSELPRILEEQVQIKSSDFVLIPYSGSKVMRYVPKGYYIPFEADDMLLLKDKSSFEFYFGNQNIDKKKVREFMQSYILKNKVMPTYYENLSENYIAKMNKGDKLIVISYRDGFTMPLINNWQIIQDVNNYNNVNLFVLMMAKVTKDSLDIAQNMLKPLEYIQVQNAGYSIFVFEKQ